MGILKCTHTISMTALLATAWSFPPRSLRMRYSGTLAARMSVPSLYCRPRPGFCSSFRSRECLRVSMPSTFMPWASASHPRSTRPVRTSIRATRTTVSWWGPKPARLNIDLDNSTVGGQIRQASACSGYGSGPRRHRIRGRSPSLCPVSPLR